MSQRLLDGLRGIDATISPTLFALALLVSKTVGKGAVRTLLQAPYDFIETTAWFIVDVMVLTVLVASSLQLAPSAGFAGHMQQWWYLLIGICGLIALLCYGWYVRLHRDGKNHLRLLPVVISLFVGYLAFSDVVEALRNSHG